MSLQDLIILSEKNEELESQLTTANKRIEGLEQELESYKTKSEYRRIDIQMKVRIKELEAENERLKGNKHD
ncbi:MAG: hypothetical protein ACPG5Z_00285 [Pseudoalteromonas sp.]